MTGPSSLHRDVDLAERLSLFDSEGTDPTGHTSQHIPFVVGDGRHRQIQAGPVEHDLLSRAQVAEPLAVLP
jgi:hypothetical protein